MPLQVSGRSRGLFILLGGIVLYSILILNYTVIAQVILKGTKYRSLLFRLKNTRDSIIACAQLLYLTGESGFQSHIEWLYPLTDVLDRLILERHTA